MTSANPLGDPPEEPDGPLIYHYTSTDALKKITESADFLCTRIDFCNDSKEGRLYPALVREAFMHADLSDDSFGNQSLRRLRSWIADGFLPSDLQFPFVTCFSEKRDSLSQWRAYGRGGTLGCAIGIDWRMLRDKSRGILQAVSYVDDSDDAAVKAVAEKLHLTYMPDVQDASQDKVVEFSDDTFPPEERSDHDAQVRETFNDATGLYNQVLFDACFYKHKSFADEAEWRLVLPPYIPGDVEYWASRFGFTPKKREHLDEIKQMIQEITVGPTPHKDLAVQAIEAWAGQAIGPHVQVRSSESPFVDW